MTGFGGIATLMKRTRPELRETTPQPTLQIKPPKPMQYTDSQRLLEMINALRTVSPVSLRMIREGKSKTIEIEHEFYPTGEKRVVNDTQFTPFKHPEHDDQALLELTARDSQKKIALIAKALKNAGWIKVDEKSKRSRYPNNQFVLKGTGRKTELTLALTTYAKYIEEIENAGLKIKRR
jgi:hypothetical protein